MENKKVGWWILGILILIGIIYWIYKQGYLAQYGFGDYRVTSEGTDPTGECGGGKFTSSSRIGSPECTKPLFFSSKWKTPTTIPSSVFVDEKCWTIEEIPVLNELGVEPIAGARPSISINSNNKKWYFSKKEGLKYCFVDSDKYPTNL